MINLMMHVKICHHWKTFSILSSYQIYLGRNILQLDEHLRLHHRLRHNGLPANHLELNHLTSQIKLTEIFN